MLKFKFIKFLILLVFANGFKFSTTVSNGIAWVVAVIFAYISNKLFVFFSKTDNVKELIKEIILFFSARIYTLIIETIFLNVTIDFYHYNSIFMKIISNIIVIILNFIFSKIFVFKKIEKKEEEN